MSATAPTPETKQAKQTRPRDGDYIPGPDRNKFNKEIQGLRTTLSDLIKKINQQRSQIDQQRKVERSKEEQEVREKLSEVSARLNKFREQENKVKDEVKKFDLDVNRKIAEAKQLRTSKGPRTVKELEHQISDLEKSLESGELSIVDEQAALKSVSALKKLRTSYAEADKIQAEIDELRKKQDEKRKSFDQSVVKTILQEKSELQKHADKFNEQRKAQRESTNKLFDLRRATQKEIDELKAKMDSMREEFKKQNQEFTVKLDERKKQRAEEQRLAKIAAGAQKKIDQAKAKLEAAKVPAFDDQVSIAHNLKRYFQNHSQKKSKNARLQFDFMAIEGLSNLNIPMPTTLEDVEKIEEKLEEKIKYYAENSERVTKEKVERAQRDLDTVLADVEKQKAEGGKTAADSTAETGAKADSKTETKADASAKTETKAETKAETETKAE